MFGKIKEVTICSEKISANKVVLLIVSDLHLTKKSGKRNLDKIKNSGKIDWNNIDYIVMPGDIIDNAMDLEDESFRLQLLKILKEFTSFLPTIVSYGNHEQLIKNGDGLRKQTDDKMLFVNTIKELSNFVLLENKQIFKDKNIRISAFSPSELYYKAGYEHFKDYLDYYKKDFEDNYQENLFLDRNYNILLSHDPQAIIELSKEKNSCIQPNTDLVISGHMHNGLMPSIFHHFVKNYGLISPRMTLFPKYAQGRLSIKNTNFIINGPVNAMVKMPLVNNLFGPSATIVTLKRK